MCARATKPAFVALGTAGRLYDAGLREAIPSRLALFKFLAKSTDGFQNTLLSHRILLSGGTGRHADCFVAFGGRHDSRWLGPGWLGLSPRDGPSRLKFSRRAPSLLSAGCCSLPLNSQFAKCGGSSDRSRYDPRRVTPRVDDAAAVGRLAQQRHPRSQRPNWSRRRYRPQLRRLVSGRRSCHRTPAR